MARQVISATETLRDGGREPVRAGRHHRPTPRPAEGASSCPCGSGRVAQKAEWEVWQPPVPLSTRLSPWLFTEQLREGHISAACV